ncbi:ABC transporter permease [Paenibacillus alvei]|uniref:ABC transporter permease n=1 Tax=Paenibacillus alvei TaxID=44250 RepID=UPI0018CD69A4|nr:ABC transporter permease [Paenibacillus alvei]MBG9732761.1 ABC transporter [Paenibacillus alvei]MBG9744170.1 ABC transporter [Paenibacillus alvei]MCY9580231.1 ABC transporter permease [Paenibacillus alvei]MCY9588140.1 ABC transporter permease [Paenibacillus alvei]
MLQAQIKAESLRIMRSPFFLLFSLGMPIAFYFLFASLNGASKSIEATTYGAFSLMSMTAFSLIGTAMSQFGIRLAYERRDGWTRLLRLTPLSPLVWIGAKIVSHMLVHMLVILIIFPAAYFAYHIELTAVQWMTCGLWLWLGSIPFLAIGSLLGTMKSADASIAVANILLMGFAIMGGLWMPLKTLPGWMQAIGEWLPSYRYAHGAWNMLAGSSPALLDWAILLSCGIIFMVISSYIFNRREAM